LLLYHDPNNQIPVSLVAGLMIAAAQIRLGNQIQWSLTHALPAVVVKEVSVCYSEI
jgi:hypothetical protein